MKVAEAIWFFKPGKLQQLSNNRNFLISELY